MKGSAWITLLAVVMVAVAAPYSMTPTGPEVPALVQAAPFSAQHGPTIKAFEPGQTPLQRLIEHIAPEHVRPDGLSAEKLVAALEALRDEIG